MLKLEFKIKFVFLKIFFLKNNQYFFQTLKIENESAKLKTKICQFKHHMIKQKFKGIRVQRNWRKFFVSFIQSLHCLSNLSSFHFFSFPKLTKVLGCYQSHSGLRGNLQCSHAWRVSLIRSKFSSLVGVWCMRY